MNAITGAGVRFVEPPPFERPAPISVWDVATPLSHMLAMFACGAGVGVCLTFIAFAAAGLI